MNNQWKTALIWALGVILAFLTALPALLFLVAKTYNIEPETLSDLIGASFFGAAIIAALPALMIAVEVDDDGLMKYFTEYGERMFFYGNFAAWVVWLAIGLLSLLFVAAFWDELIGSPDGHDVFPRPLYRQVWGWMKKFALAILIMVLPNREGEVPD